MHETQLTALPARPQTIGACREVLRQAHVAVVRHVAVAEGAHHVAAFVLDPGLANGTKLYTGEQLAGKGAELKLTHGSELVFHAQDLSWSASAPDHSNPSSIIARDGQVLGEVRENRLMGRYDVRWAPGVQVNDEAAPIKVANADLVRIYHGLKSADILDGIEPGSHADAILAAFGRAVLKAYGVQLTEERV